MRCLSAWRKRRVMDENMAEAEEMSQVDQREQIPALKCGLCDSVFKSKDDLKQHMKLAHVGR
jgi:hypothetical protein